METKPVKLSLTFQRMTRFKGIRVATFWTVARNQLGSRTMTIEVNVLESSVIPKFVKGNAYHLVLEEADPDVALPCAMTLISAE